MKRSNSKMGRVVLPLWATMAIGCADADARPEEAEPTATAGAERPPARADAMETSGLLGTIPREQVENTLNARMMRFQRCVAERSDELEYLAGDIRLSFRIHTDGSVAWVYPVQTTFGDRQTERCILEVAAETRFPRPRGGEAEFSWGFGFGASDDVRPPDEWSGDALGDRLEDVEAVAEECQASGGIDVTAYIEPGGTVIAAGGSLPDAASEQTLECILELVRAWEMPDPGSYPAKITFPVQ